MKRLFLFLVSFLLAANFVFGQEHNSPKFSGLMFGDYFYNAASRDVSKKDLNGFQFRRIYITTDYSISSKFSSRFRLEADQGEITNNGKITVMVKDAWLKWKNIFNGSDFMFGISPTPAYDVSEGAWGHRFLEKTIMDLNGIVPSRDLGIDLKGNLNDKGSVKYWLKIGNNSGNSPESNKYKRFYGLLEFKPSADFLITVYGDYASAGNVFDPVINSSVSHNSTVAALFLNYKLKDKFSIGLESYYRTIQNNFASSQSSSLQAQNGYGISLWAYASLAGNLKLVGRFDTNDPNTDLKNDGKSLILAGIDYSPVENVTITPNVEVTTYQAAAPQGANKSDVTPRLTFFWEF